MYKPAAPGYVVNTFSIRPGVAVYGGFAGTENSRNGRDLAANVTILSGDIDSNDSNTDNNNIDETSADISGSNSFHVVTMDGTTGAGNITASTVLDGFTITGGDANDTYNVGYSFVFGGGFYCKGRGAGKQCSPSLRNVAFRGNYAAQNGGAMFNDGYGGNSSPTLSNVSFSGNSTNFYGGAIFNYGSAGGTSSPSFSNVTFSGNSAGSAGGAIYNDGESGSSSPSLRNVTFSANVANYGGAMFNDGGGQGICSPSLSNVIAWGDTGLPGYPEIYSTATTQSIDHSVVQGSGGSGAGWVISMGTDGGGNLDADPKLGALGNHGGSTATVLIGSGSSAVDAGSDAVCAAAQVNGLDQRGVIRPQGPHCDIGAVEQLDEIFANGFEAIP